MTCEQKWGILTHTDMDAAGANIMLRNLYPVAVTTRCGYGKVDKTLSDLNEEGVTHLAVADISLTPNQLEIALGLFQTVVYFDHHLQSQQHVGHRETGLRFFPYIDMTKSSTLLVAEALIARIEKNLDNKVLPFVRLSRWINAYDLWHKDDPLFRNGYDLNILFSIVGFDKFVIMFRDGYDQKEYLPYSEKVDARKAEILSSIENTEMMESGKDALFFLEDANIVNDFTIFRPKYRIYYMVYKSNEGWRLSIRVRDDFINMSEYLSMLNTHNDWGKVEHLIPSRGGHAKACGVTFSSEATLEDVVEVVDMIQSMVHEDDAVSVGAA